MVEDRDRKLLALVEDARQGVPSDAGQDPRNELYRETYPVLRRYLFRKTRSLHPAPSQEDLEDILQDSYADAFRSLDTFDPAKSGLMTWLATIATRRSYKWVKRASRNPAVFSIHEPDEGCDVPHREPSTPGHILIEEQQILKELLHHMSGSIRSIPNTDYRVVVALVFFGWFTLLELRRVLGFKPNTLKSAYRRGLKELGARVSMRSGPSYEALALQIMETHKRGSLAKGMAVLDTDHVQRVDDRQRRDILDRLLIREEPLETVSAALGLSGPDVVVRVKEGVDELLALVERELG